MLLTDEDIQKYWNETYCAAGRVLILSFARKIESHVKQPDDKLRSSNLDLNNKLIKRGLIVSYHGIRGRVTKVNRGYLLMQYPDGTYSKPIKCNDVQVVAQSWENYVILSRKI